MAVVFSTSFVSCSGISSHFDGERDKATDFNLTIFNRIKCEPIGNELSVVVTNATAMACGCIGLTGIGICKGLPSFVLCYVCLCAISLRRRRRLVINY